MRLLLASILVLFVLRFAHSQSRNMAMYNPTDPKTYYLKTNTPYNIPFVVVEKGPVYSSTMKYSYSVNGGDPVSASVSFDQGHPTSCVNNFNLSSYRVEFAVPLILSAEGSYRLKIWIDSLDGLVDINHSNDTMVRNYKALNNLPPRKGLTEYGFHITCGPCGESGPPYLESLLTTFEPYSVLVKLHNYGIPNSPFSRYDCTEAIQIDEMFSNSAHPKFTFNRADIRPYSNPNFAKYLFYPDVDFCPTNYNYFIQDIPFFTSVPSDLDVHQFAFNSVTNEFSFQMQAIFPDDITFAQETRMSCMLVEDSIYDYQYDNGGPALDSTWHRNVLRTVFGGSWGKAGSLPAQVVANQPYTLNLSGVLKPGWNKQQLYLVPTLQYYNATANKREVLNVKRIRVPDLSVLAGNLPVKEQNQVLVYPNPADGIAWVEAGKGQAISGCTVLSIDGKKQFRFLSGQILNSAAVSIPTKDMANGTYLLTVSLTDGTHKTIRLVVNH
ncbi:MAG TPA: T9SS type A sorting domain-containing protein [Catalimonadaceae bacterium]|nr:T9SS type A sorting domain-containing protein [Catalimonadaceae bacterium]